MKIVLLFFFFLLGFAQYLSFFEAFSHNDVLSVYMSPNKKMEPCPPSITSPRAFLMQQSPGAYTCMRTVSQTKVLMYNFHLERLLFSISTVLKEVHGLNQKKQISLDDGLKDEIKQLVGEGLQYFWETNPKIKTERSDTEAMITVLGTPTPCFTGVEFSVHVCAAPSSTNEGVHVRIYGNKRQNPESKLSQWCWDRREIEVHKTDGIYEMILSQQIQNSDDRLLLEGLVTNLFLVREGEVYTAPEGVLHGQMRELVLQACRDLGVRVHHEAPKLSEIRTFNEGFLTGTGRIITPILSIDSALFPFFNDDSTITDSQYLLSPNSLTMKIKDQIGTLLLQNAFDVCG
mmetsp:Transcript_2279/g.3166  ORF Transcript_2279/g.3166 Transcript_2279/m.3166 type:complete len:345 (-) Transcript_2279:169-1203(-)